MRFKIGDKVKIKDMIEAGSIIDGCNFADEMRGFCGGVYTVQEIIERPNIVYPRYVLSLGTNTHDWVWIDPWLEPVAIIDIKVDSLKELLMEQE